MSPQDDGERARGEVRREYSLAFQATCRNFGWRAATATLTHRTSVWKSLYADCRDWCHFAPNSDQGKKACRARGDAPTAQQAGSKSGAPASARIRWTTVPPAQYAKIASVFYHPQRPLLALNGGSSRCSKWSGIENPADPKCSRRVRPSPAEWRIRRGRGYEPSGSEWYCVLRLTPHEAC